MSSQAAAEVVGSFLSQPVRDKTVSTAEAIRLIRDRDTVVVGGFLGACFPEELTLALEERFRGAGGPRELTVVFPVAAGDLKGRGLDRLAHAGLLRRAIGGRWAAAPGLQKLAVEGAIEAYNLPLGCMSQLFQDIAGRKPGSLSRVGLGTFVDPRYGGGKINQRTHGVQTIAADAAGTGASTRYRRPRRMPGLARTFELMLDTLEYEQVDVLGVSFGGILAQQLAHQAPGRVRRLVLAATGAGVAGLGGVPGSPRAMLALATPRRYQSPDYYRRVAGGLYGGLGGWCGSASCGVEARWERPGVKAPR